MTYLEFILIVAFFIIVFYLYSIRKRIEHIIFPSREKEEKHIKICPQCGSTNIKIPPAGMDLRMTQSDYCKYCKNRGMFLEIKESEVEYLKKKLKKNK